MAIGRGGCFNLGCGTGFRDWGLGLGLSLAVDDAAAGQVVGGHLHHHPVPGKDADVMLAHFAGHVSQDLNRFLPHGGSHQEHGVGQGLDHRGLELDGFGFGQWLLCVRTRWQLPLLQPTAYHVFFGRP